MATRLNISIPDDLVEAVKQIKEEIGISRFFRNKLKEFIQEKKECKTK